MTKWTKEQVEKAKAEHEDNKRKAGRPPLEIRPERLNLYVPPEIAENFRELAGKNGRTLSAQFEWMVKAALNKK